MRRRSMAASASTCRSIMTDVFLSYANGDRERAREVANALSARGWSVWWDRKIKAGQTFDEVIERELDTAKHIVVLWSKDSVVSEWVRNEAAVAAQRRVLVPVLLDDVKVPLEFRRRQTADLIGWDGDPSHAGLQTLFEALEGAPPESARAPAPAAAPARPTRRPLPWTVAGAAGFVLGCVLTYLVVGSSASQSAAPARDSVAPGASSASAAVKRQSTKVPLPANLTTSERGIQLDVVAFQKTGELATLEWIFRNTSDQKVNICGKAADARLIDQVTGESWRALHSGGPAASCEGIARGGQSGAWAKFKVPTLENRRLSLSLPSLNSAPELPLPQAASN